ncbi:MAG: extracellular solute-binding protein [Paracoccaceae bacterium]
MTQQFFTTLRGFVGAIALACTPLAALGDSAPTPMHGIAMYGEPALPPDFVSLPYTNPDAPKGGRIVFGEAGSFDSLNPFIIKGSSTAAVTYYTVETLMGRSLDEPFSLYGLLAESVTTDAERSFVEFTLRDGARFSDGSPVTVEDVIWSFETLGTKGNPRYAGAWKKIATTEQTGPRSVRFTFTVTDRELPLILGLRPILQKAQFEGRDFAESSLVPVIGSGPYIVGKVDPGRSISFVRNPNWWGADVPFYRGMHNFDEIRHEFFGDGGVVFEAFKAGEIDSFRETNPAKWQTNYSFPAVASGDVVLSEIPHGRPSGIDGFAFNTRRPIFADWRVRQALIHLFNFELVNTTLNGGAVPRIQSYFSNSELGAEPGTPATGAVLALLEPFRADLLPGAIDGYALPVADGSEANRKNLRAANALLEEAGWTVQDGVLKNAEGTPFAFEILLVNGATDHIAAANIYIEAMKRVGIDARLTTIDSAQYNERTKVYDFDMTQHIRSLTLSPGNEQMLYWGSAGVTEPGTRNWMGMNSPAAEAMIAAMLKATSREDFVPAVQALDRILISGRYVVPIWYSDKARIAHVKRLRFPERLPLYGDWPGFQPEVWWLQE